MGDSLVDIARRPCYDKTRQERSSIDPMIRIQMVSVDERRCFLNMLRCRRMALVHRHMTKPAGAKKMEISPLMLSHG